MSEQSTTSADGYTTLLARALARRGVPGAARRRILDEIADHLQCDPAAQLGDPATLADQFADELGTRHARRAAFGAFGALAIAAGLLGAATFLANSGGGIAVQINQHASALGTIGLALVALGAQVAFVSGGLGAVRALRRRRVGVISRSEARVLTRRAAVGLVAGLITMLGLALSAVAFKGEITRWSAMLALAGAGALALAAAIPILVAASRLLPRLDGPAGDLREDLHGLVPVLDPGSWPFAVLVAGGVGVAVVLAGVAGADPLDGLLRGLLEAGACFAGYVLLGRYLGLREAASRAPELD